MLWTIGVGSNIWKVDFGFSRRAELLLGLLGFILDALHSGGIFAEINTVFFLEFFEDIINNTVIEVFTAKVSITVGSHHFEDAIANIENGDIEGTTT